MLEKTIRISSDGNHPWEIINKEKVKDTVIMEIRNKSTEEEYLGEMLSITSRGDYQVLLTEKITNKPKKINNNVYN